MFWPSNGEDRTRLSQKLNFRKNIFDMGVKMEKKRKMHFFPPGGVRNRNGKKAVCTRRRSSVPYVRGINRIVGKHWEEKLWPICGVVFGEKRDI